MSLQVSAAGRRYGRLIDVADSRDLRMNAAPVFRLPYTKLPPVISLIPWLGPVKDQGSEGSCTGHAYSSYREFLARKYQNEGPVLSPQFLYVQELLFENTFPSDGGAMPRSGCIVLNQNGCCEETVWPYVPGNLVKPTPVQLDNAKKWLGGAYHRISFLADILSCINSGYCCSVGFFVYQSFESDEVANTGIMPMPKKDEALLGGHEVLCVGYDIPNRRALIQNSWGTSWGINGRFWMPFDFISDARYVSDLWMTHLGRAWRAA